MIKEITIPEIGEKIESGKVVGVLVSEGDTVDVDQPLIEFETDKAVVEIPSTEKGKITEISVKDGDEVKIGEVFAKIDTEGKGSEEEAEGEEKEEKAEKKKAEPKEEKAESADEEEEEPAEEEEKKPEEPEEEDSEEEEEPEEKPREEKKEKPEKKDEKPAARKAAKDDRPAQPDAGEINGEPAPAAPSVRRLARELGADINAVEGSGPGGRITIDDVKAHVRGIVTSKKMPSEPSEQRATGPQQRPLPDFSEWGEIDRQPMSRVRAITADSTGYAWNVVPHVTQFDRADVTELETFREKYSKAVEKAGGKLTVTAILLKVIVAALKKYPRFNASLDMEQEEIIYKDYYHIGMAVDTDRGLLVPVIRDVDKKSITDLALELIDLADRTRNKKVKPEEMEGGTFTISNQGSIGGVDFTPIVYWPQVAILGVSRSSVQPKYMDGEFKPRTILPLSLSYDHRMIDGADAARFLRWVVEALEHPFLMVFDD
ncbi:biotin/lipoyl-binding protein [candidate division GN15 bacterium]|nr:biotin/lipoyl-binding protein [candidate division GN15 bacterium]